MSFWYLDPELVAEIKISRDQGGNFRVSSHHLDKPKRANPEEMIRQLVLAQLRCHYKYPHECLLQEYPIKMGIAKKRADIAILNKNNEIEAIIEVKLNIDEEAILQLQSYVIATGAKYGAVISPYTRKVFARTSNCSFSQVTDLPMYEGEAVGSRQRIHPTSEINPHAIALMEALGILKLERATGSTSYLYLKNKILKITNTSLLSYANVRRQAIHQGIVLPSAVKDEDWDAVLCHLFENACEAEVYDNNQANVEISAFINQACQKTDDNTRVPFTEIYDHFVSWYKVNGENSKKFLPSKKAVSSHLGKNGFVRRNMGGRLYIFGLRPQSPAAITEKHTTSGNSGLR